MQLYFLTILYCTGEGIHTWKQSKAPLHIAAVFGLHNKKHETQTALWLTLI